MRLDGTTAVLARAGMSLDIIEVVAERHCCQSSTANLQQIVTLSEDSRPRNDSLQILYPAQNTVLLLEQLPYPFCPILELNSIDVLSQRHHMLKLTSENNLEPPQSPKLAIDFPLHPIDL
ncbi:unnamed protein product [Phytophthora lilii]|uniref:Unnamed protein product n=1 Tax=Phytophthora lilii TaxID=2077276 RepID=A0A9W6U4S2_9STRA|nr:unnamed protein product [Phytophthora lilii]